MKTMFMTLCMNDREEAQTYLSNADAQHVAALHELYTKLTRLNPQPSSSADLGHEPLDPRQTRLPEGRTSAPAAPDRASKESAARQQPPETYFIGTDDDDDSAGKAAKQHSGGRFNKRPGGPTVRSQNWARRKQGAPDPVYGQSAPRVDASTQRTPRPQSVNRSTQDNGQHINSLAAHGY